jgi:hypothetical protein
MRLTDAYDATQRRDRAGDRGQARTNPLRDGYYDEAFRALARREPVRRRRIRPTCPTCRRKSSGSPRFQRAHPRRPARRDAAAQPAIYAELIGADRPVSQDAIGLANKAQADYAKASAEAGGGVAPFAVGLAGGLLGGLRDPVQLAGLLAGGGEVKAASVVGKIFEGGIRQGLVNAGLQALGEPQVQAWRAERGQETGFLPAAEDIGLAALFGFIPGAAFKAAGVAFGRSAPEAATVLRNAASGDRTAATAVAEHLGPDVAPDLHAAIAADRLDEAAMPAIPDSVTPAAAGDIYRQAVRHAEDPAQPLAEIPARDREAPPEKLLAPDALEMLLDGRADPMTAHAVATRVADANEQASILREAMQSRPQNAQDAAIAVSDAMERRAVTEAQAAALGMRSRSVSLIGRRATDLSRCPILTTPPSSISARG